MKWPTIWPIDEVSTGPLSLPPSSCQPTGAQSLSSAVLSLIPSASSLRSARGDGNQIRLIPALYHVMSYADCFRTHATDPHHLPGLPICVLKGPDVHSRSNREDEDGAAEDQSSSTGSMRNPTGQENKESRDPMTVRGAQLPGPGESLQRRNAVPRSPFLHFVPFKK